MTSLQNASNFGNRALNARWFLPALCIGIVIIGTFFRVARWELPQLLGFDEYYYVEYTNWHLSNNLTELPVESVRFLEKQTAASIGLPPPFRLFYPYSAMLASRLTGIPAAEALVLVSILATCVMLWASTGLAWRMFGPGPAAGIAALTAVSFNQIHQAQRIMVDGVLGALTMIAIWCVWEIGRQNRKVFIWVIYLITMFCIVLVKESAFFIYIGIAALIVLGKPLKIFPSTPKHLMAATVLTGGVAFTLICLSAGGFEQFFLIYITLVQKSLATPYVIAMGDGPWFRYIIDSMMAQPLITIFAIGGIMHLPFKDKWLRYLCVFMAATFALMCQIKYGQFFRYSIIWDLTLRSLAFFQIAYLFRKWIPAKWSMAFPVLIFVICLHEFWVYWQICVINDAYALESLQLLQNLNMYRTQMPR